MPSATGPGFVAVPDDAVLAARVIRHIGDRGEPYRIDVRDGTVTFDYDPSRLLTSDLSREISQLRGVTSVRARVRER